MKFIIGRWYWVTYQYTRWYILEDGTKREIHGLSSTELKKCLAIKDDGTFGVFETNRLNKRWIEASKCAEYSGNMRYSSFLGFLFKDKEDMVPDV